MIKFTSIITSATYGVVSVRAHTDWMGDTEIDAYLDGIEDADDGTCITFARMALHADVGDCDGGWVSAYRRSGSWDLASGA